MHGHISASGTNITDLGVGCHPAFQQLMQSSNSIDTHTVSTRAAERLSQNAPEFPAMPRPKVDPANRLRANMACLSCRISKRRCTGTFPCPTCIQRGLMASCGPCPRTDAGVQSRDASSTTVPAPACNPVDSPVSNPRSIMATTTTSPHSHAPDPPSAGSAGAQHRTHPRMLWNRQGERVYVGKAASLSFLQLLRDTVTQHIGPSQFSHNVKSEDMLETESPHHVPSTFGDHLSPGQKEAFVRAYHTATSGLIYVISEFEAIALVHEPLDLDKERENSRRALRDVIIAIGAQSWKTDPDTVQIERFFFNRGQRRAFSSMLETPNLEMVRLFLCMSFYMLGACRRNAAFMYLGVAARAAVALGLHQTDSSGAITPDERQKRSRVWMSLCVLDLLVSSILGRPPATATVHLDVDYPADLDQLSSRMDASLVASYRLSLILDEIITRLYSDKAASAEVAELLLKKLTRWSDQLPESILTPPNTEQERHAAQGQIIGSLHVACSYHFAVIVVTRPFLVSVLGVRLARLHHELSDRTPDQVVSRPEEDPAHARLSVACVDSALYMIQTCLEIHQSDLLLASMCILKAFIFAAALVLGFSMFSQREVDSALDAAFNGALDIMRMLSQQSAQAGHYLEILTLLSNAITEQRQRLASHAGHSRSRYVSKLFSLKRPRSPETQTQESTRESSLATSQENILQSEVQSDRSAPIMPSDIDVAFSGWEGMELPLWDSFPYITEPFQLQDKTSETLQ